MKPSIDCVTLLHPETARTQARLRAQRRRLDITMSLLGVALVALVIVAL